jgi:hypothetical protein
MTINRLNQGTTNQVLVKAISGQTTNLLELQDSSGNVVSSIGPTGALGGTVSQPQGLVHIKTESIGSGVSSVSVNDVFSATYKNYKVIINFLASAGATLALRLRVSGSDESGSNYNNQRLGVEGSTVVGARSTGQTSANIGSATEVAISLSTLEIANPFLTTPTIVDVFHGRRPSSTTVEMLLVANGLNTSTSYTGFTIFPSSGTLSSGAINVYGYRD